MKMVILINSIFFFLFIFLLSSLEPFIHRIFFSGLVEAENQTYMLGIAFFLAFQFFLFSYSSKKIFGFSIQNRKFIYQILILSNFIFIFFSLNLIRYIQQSETIQKDLSLVEIHDAGSIPTTGYIIGCLITFFILIVLSIKKSIPRIVSFFGITLSIGIILFLTLGVGKLNLYDYTNYAGPINDLILGKPILTYRTSYGFIPILILGLVFRFIPLTSEYLHVSIAVINSIYYLVSYFLIVKIFKSIKWATVCVIVAIFVQHLITWGATYQIPQQTLIRVGVWIPIALTIFSQSKLAVKSINLSLSLPVLLSGLIFFWVPDFGLYTVLAFLIYDYLLSLNSNFFQFVRILFLRVIRLILIIGFWFVFISVIYLCIYGTFPQWVQHYFNAYTYQNSGQMSLVPNIPFLWGYIYIYVLTISYLIYRKLFDKKFTARESSLLYIACVGLVSFNYFLGRSFLNSINVLSLPFWICFFYLAKEIVSISKLASKKIAINTIILLTIILFIPGTLIINQGVKALKNSNPLSTIRLLRKELPNQGNEEFWVGQTVKLMKEKYPTQVNSGRIAILSMWDTWVLIMLHATNVGGINCLICYYFPADNLDFIAENMLNSKYSLIFVDTDKSLVGGRVNYIFAKIKENYSYIDSIGFLDVYERK